MKSFILASIAIISLIIMCFSKSQKPQVYKSRSASGRIAEAARAWNIPRSL